MPLFTNRPRKASRLAIAAALMSVGALGVTAYETPAYAQKAPKYSKDFIKAFAPINEELGKENPDYASLRDRMTAPQVRESVKNDDDRLAYGGALYNLGRQLEDLNLQRTGIELMLDSGKVTEADLPQYTFVAGTIAYDLNDYAAARTYLEKAASLGYKADTAQSLIAQAAALENNEAGSIGYFDTLIQQNIDAGTKPAKELLQQAVRTAYQSEQYEPSTKYSILLARYYPDAVTWGDAVNIQRNFKKYGDEETLDLLRLLRAADALDSGAEYEKYIEVAGVRQLPGEVLAVTQEGLAAGLISRDVSFVANALSEATNRSEIVSEDLSALASEARASGATAKRATLAGDAHFSLDRFAQAAELYQLALTRSDVDRETVLTRLGIAQVMAGDYANARETFAKVQGERQGITRLWSAHAEQRAEG